ELVLGGAGQRQDLLDVFGVAAEQGAGVGVFAGVEGRVRQGDAALGEVADVAVEGVQVEIGAEIEGHGDADLVQGGDRGRDVAGAADGIDAREQGGDRLGAVAFDQIGRAHV